MNPVNRWRISAILLVICCIALMERVIDQGITLSYRAVDDATTIRHIELLTGLLEHEWLGLSEEKVMTRLNRHVASYPASSIVLKRDSDENIICLDGACFEFRDGKFVNTDSCTDIAHAFSSCRRTNCCEEYSRHGNQKKSGH
ncbi:hypothetical protein D8B23_12430 [Verminephrobacter aporrectodeae subsp. tuberculatae]|uniref:Uncharacterized protein n=1 Tax=Verminephrobacter aporrectodeae subsp. tuberculatae TaxID=1110392 RepID=A0ABT3KXC7_9BURK|nr:Imm58 family immunity protein [Verminephrobacter aporrectodeae]MCW5322995.1 hypothetical protein [Verminephrobacter aporrectodeae subsp. tuberculatae]MCW8167112.1 hypothetical protein [Verminephrobacter aporrectodeae subsp. tuberculatae]MCW8171312.1 hypothetical protein [Verminephrobacter aporrectodeae subsp. tuberculatae]MCW8199210.1 hypothetical protein [Verminephrobacter aporrectodeae subsp. tuberculatae]